MKKIYIATLLAATAITFVSAQDAKPMPTKPEMKRGGVEANGNAMIPTIGDATIDAQLKVLTLEMEAKIKAIHEEYSLKIQTLIGNKRLILPIGGKAPGVRGEMKKEDRPMGTTAPGMRGEPKKDDRPDDRSTVEADATTTSQIMNDDVEAHTEMNTDFKQVMPQNIGARIKNFFRVFFGGDN